MKLAGLLLFLICAAPIMAEASEEGSWTDPFLLSGWMDTVQSTRTGSPGRGLLTSRVRLRLELSADFEEVYGFVSADAEKNWEIKSETGVDLHEAWLEHAGDGWDIRVGRQIIIWGRADGVQITDIISPPDYTEAFTRDLDETRLPVDALKFRLLGDSVTTELVWIPVFRAAILASGDNPWAIQQGTGNGSTYYTPTREPGISLKNSELGLKVSRFSSGLDLAASVLYTWDDYSAKHPVLSSNEGTTFVTYIPEHHRLTVFGLECSRPWSDFVFRGEAAYYLGRYLDTQKVTENPLRKDVLYWLGGTDWTPGNDWTLIAQLTGAHIMGYDPRLADEEHTFMATLNVSKKLLRQTLTLSNMLYYHINDNELYSRMKGEYEVTDDFRLALGADIFLGSNGQFGVYKDNSQVWMKAKYSF